MQALPSPLPVVQEEGPPSEEFPNLLPVELPGDGQDNSQLFSWIQPVMRWKDYIVLDRFGPSLPTERCCKCNSSSDKRVQKSYSANGSSPYLLAVLAMISVPSFVKVAGISLWWMLLLLPLMAPIVLLGHFFKKSRATVEFGICKRCANQRLLGSSLGVAILMASLAFYILAFMLKSYPVFPLIAGNVALLVGSLTLAKFVGLGIVKRVDQRWLIFRGCGKDFRESLPESPIPQF